MTCPSRTKEGQAKYWAKNKHRWYTPVIRLCAKCGEKFSPKAKQSLCQKCRRRECGFCKCSFIPKFGQLGQVCCSRRCAALFDVARTEKNKKRQGPQTAHKIGDRNRQCGCVEGTRRKDGELVTRLDTHEIARGKDRQKSIAAGPDLWLCVCNLCHPELDGVSLAKQAPAWPA